MKAAGIRGVMAAIGLASLLTACDGVVATSPVMVCVTKAKATAEPAVTRAQAPLDLNKPEPNAILAAWADWASHQDDGFVEPAGCSVDSFKAIRVGDEKDEALVAFLNVNCQADPAIIFVVWQAQGKVNYQELGTERGHKEGVRDLRGDGKIEIIVNTALGDGFAAVYWPDVYEWSSNGFVMKSKDYIQSYYVPEYLPELSRMIGYAMEDLDSSPGESKEQIEAAKRLRAVSLEVLAECQEGLKRLAALSQKSERGQESERGQSAFPADNRKARTARAD